VISHMDMMKILRSLSEIKLILTVTGDSNQNNDEHIKRKSNFHLA